MAPKRGRKDDDDDKGGPSKVQLRGLSWNTSAAQPAFLKNAMAALQGPKPARDLGEGSGRPAIPERPDGEGEESEEDEWDMGRGEEAPAVVVLKEGRHIDRSEVDRIRAEAKAASSADPLASSAAPAGPAKATGSLNFSSGAPKEKGGSGEVGTESWEEVIKRSKIEAATKALIKEQKEQDEAKAAEKEKKRKLKEKKDAKKKIGMLSFGDE